MHIDHSHKNIPIPIAGLLSYRVAVWPVDYCASRSRTRRSKRSDWWAHVGHPAIDWNNRSKLAYGLRQNVFVLISIEIAGVGLHTDRRKIVITLPGVYINTLMLNMCGNRTVLILKRKLSCSPQYRDMFGMFPFFLVWFLVYLSNSLTHHQIAYKVS